MDRMTDGDVVLDDIGIVGRTLEEDVDDNGVTNASTTTVFDVDVIDVVPVMAMTAAIVAMTLMDRFGIV